MPTSEPAEIAECRVAGPAATWPTPPAILGVSPGVAVLVVLDPHDLLPYRDCLLHHHGSPRLFRRLGHIGLHVRNLGDTQRGCSLRRRFYGGDRSAQLRQFGRGTRRRDRGLARRDGATRR